MKYCLLACLAFLCSCASRNVQEETPHLSSVQLIDRHGFSETISVKERLSTFEKIDFETPQSYQKVLRVFKRDSQGKNSSRITSYHPNGQIWQYLDVLDGRAHGNYKQWHSNGKLNIEAKVIEGIADIHDLAKSSWVFDGKNNVWDEEGRLVAEISYVKGNLEGPSLYYHPNGKLHKSIPYLANEIEGTSFMYDEAGEVLEQTEYKKGLKTGLSLSTFAKEEYDKGLLQTGSYYNKEKALVAEVKEGCGKQALFTDGNLSSLVTYNKGVADGIVELFRADGSISSTYSIKEGKKNGEEWAFYPNSQQPKLFVFWQDDAIQGMVKTWYENGTMESQREMNANKKQGLAFAWYKDGSLMLMEEYDKDLLVKGTYLKKGDKKPVSEIKESCGVATLHNPDGHFLKKIAYEKGKPSED